nr:MAG: putative maturation protein [Leviviridae sp.]
MPTRQRERTGEPIVGEYFVKNGTTTLQGWTGRHTSTEICNDTVGQRNQDNGFLLEKYERKFQPMTGSRPGSSPVDKYVNYYPVAVQTVVAHINQPIPSVNSAAVKAIAGTNPSRSVVSVPRALYELKDLPGLVKQGGDLLRRFNSSRKSPKDVARYLSSLRAARDGAGIYLGNEFGVQPIISDVRKLLDFQSHVSKRKRELDRLYSKGGLKRRYTTYSGVSNVEDNAVTVDSILGTSIRCRTSGITTSKQWVTLKWRPDPGTIPRTDAQKLKLARAAVFGAQVGIGDVWDVMPWSWMIDWFGNVGDYLHAHDNTVPAKSSSVNVMTHRKTVYTYTRFGNEWCVGGGGVMSKESKERTPVTGIPLPEANQPVITDWRLSILGALAVTKGTR